LFQNFLEELSLNWQPRLVLGLLRVEVYNSVLGMGEIDLQLQYYGANNLLEQFSPDLQNWIYNETN